MSVPSRRGQPWSDDEIQNLLQAVRKKESIEQIAQKHERTPGGIRSRLRELAADYYFNDNRPIDEIMKYTGLDSGTISDAISKRQYAMDLKEKKEKINPSNPMIQTTLLLSSSEARQEGSIALLKEIRDMMKEILVVMKKEHV